MIEMLDQGSDAWFEARIGRITASRIKDVMAKTKTGYATSRSNYAAELMLERVTGQRASSYTNASMQWGTDTEPLARLAFSDAMGVDVQEVGFIQHPTIENSGASPDGLIGGNAILEIKCPNTATHCQWAMMGEVPPEHRLQMMWQLACTDRSVGYFCSFDHRMPEGSELFVRRIARDDLLIKQIEAEVIAFDQEVDNLVTGLRSVIWVPK